MNGKLMFTLCRKCVEINQHETCKHTDDDRALTGVGCTPELEMAIKKGYRIIKMYEVYHFANSEKYDGFKGGLFTEYVNMWLKIKQESSDYPKNCITDAQKRQYIDNLFQSWFASTSEIIFELIFGGALE